MPPLPASADDEPQGFKVATPRNDDSGPQYRFDERRFIRGAGWFAGAVNMLRARQDTFVIMEQNGLRNRKRLDAEQFNSKIIFKIEFVNLHKKITAYLKPMEEFPWAHPTHNSGRAHWEALWNCRKGLAARQAAWETLVRPHHDRPLATGVSVDWLTLCATQQYDNIIQDLRDVMAAWKELCRSFFPKHWETYFQLGTGASLIEYGPTIPIWNGYYAPVSEHHRR